MSIIEVELLCALIVRIDKKYKGFSVFIKIKKWNWFLKGGAVLNYDHNKGSPPPDFHTFLRLWNVFDSKPFKLLKKLKMIFYNKYINFKLKVLERNILGHLTTNEFK